MNTSTLIWLICLIISGSLPAQISDRSTAVRMMHCIQAGQWLVRPLSEQKQWRVSYTRDVKSYPGQEHIVLLVFSTERNGQVFDFARERSGAKTSLAITNNAGFRIDKGKALLKDPLWGIWTRQHLEANILKAVNSQRFVITTEELQNDFSGVACSSYADR